MKSLFLTLFFLIFALSTNAQEVVTSCIVTAPRSTCNPTFAPAPTGPVTVQCIVPTGVSASLPAQCTTITQPQSQGLTSCIVQTAGGGTLSQCAGGPTPIGTSTCTTATVPDISTTEQTGTPIPAATTGTNTGSTGGSNTAIPAPSGAARKLGGNGLVAGGLLAAIIL